MAETRTPGEISELHEVVRALRELLGALPSGRSVVLVRFDA